MNHKLNGLPIPAPWHMTLGATTRLLILTTQDRTTTRGNLKMAR